MYESQKIKISLILLLLSLPVFALPLEGKRCAELSALVWRRGFDPHLGEVSPNAPNHLDPKAQWLRLGSGFFGGTVFRVIPVDGRAPYVVKQYRTVDSCKNDLVAFGWYKEVISPGEGFGIIAAESIDEITLRLSDSKGRTVEDLVKTSEVNVSAKLIASYNEQISKVKKEMDNWVSQQRMKGRIFEFTNKEDLSPRNPNLKIVYGNLKEVVPFGSQREPLQLKFVIKPDGVIVNENGSMTIIDPR